MCSASRVNNEKDQSIHELVVRYRAVQTAMRVMQQRLIQVAKDNPSKLSQSAKYDFVSPAVAEPPLLQKFRADEARVHAVTRFSEPTMASQIRKAYTLHGESEDTKLAIQAQNPEWFTGTNSGAALARTVHETNTSDPAQSAAAMLSTSMGRLARAAHTGGDLDELHKKGYVTSGSGKRGFVNLPGYADKRSDTAGDTTLASQVGLTDWAEDQAMVQAAYGSVQPVHTSGSPRQATQRKRRQRQPQEPKLLAGKGLSGSLRFILRNISSNNEEVQRLRARERDRTFGNLTRAPE